MLRAAMMNWVGCHIDSTDVVTIDNCRRSNRDVKLLKKLPQPAALGDDMSHSSVLRLRTGGRPRDEIVAEVDAEARGGASRVGAASPIRIRVCSEGLDRADAQVKTEGECALHVAKDPLEQC
jgi:hypothetical protein